MLSPTALKIVIALPLLSFSFVAALDCGSNDDCKTYAGNFSICSENKTCVCEDFYVFVNISESSVSCEKMASYGRRCAYEEQCQATMGPLATCDLTVNACDCFSPAADSSDEIVLHEGRCVTPRGIGQACSHPYDCKLGGVNYSVTLNEFADCVSNKCQCQMMHDVLLHTVEENGVCVSYCESCKKVEISLFASMTIGAAVLFVIVFAIYRTVNSRKKK